MTVLVLIIFKNYFWLIFDNFLFLVFKFFCLELLHENAKLLKFDLSLKNMAQWQYFCFFIFFNQMIIFLMTPWLATFCQICSLFYWICPSVDKVYFRFCVYLVFQSSINFNSYVIPIIGINEKICCRYMEM